MNNPGLKEPHVEKHPDKDLQRPAEHAGHTQRGNVFYLKGDSVPAHKNKPGQQEIMSKNKVGELYNFIYCKIGALVADLLSGVRAIMP